VISDYIREMRLKQWYKAAIVFSGPLFSGMIFSPAIFKVALCFLAFGLIASSVYVINDLKDAKKDRLHPKKKHRPIASGRISKKSALIFSAVLFTLSMLLAFTVDNFIPAFVLAYFAIMMAYTFYLKSRPVVDAFIIAIGFLIRAFAGCFAIGVNITSWFYLVIFSLAVYLAFCKRVTELILAGKNHKESLEVYSKIAEVGIAISGALTITLYSIYAMMKGGGMEWSVPFVFLGLLLHLKETFSGHEVHEALKSPEMLIAGAGFLLTVILSLY
jgi:decaprenyl-phosphate phosphoribosyltransferase